MKKRKIFKTLALSSLAVVMAAGGIFAFAPIGANASEGIETTTERVGLIEAKVDDPVIYTTEYGLEIKFGNAVSASATMNSGNLTGFPYFTTTKNGTEYIWVIIGRNANVNILTNALSAHLYSTWKATNSVVNGTFAKYYFENIDSFSPAGATLNSVLATKAYIQDKVLNNTPKTSTEIPSGCVLALANTATTGLQVWSSGHWDNAYSYDASLNNNSQGKNNTREVCDNYYTNDTFGFGPNLSSLQSTTLTQYGVFWSSAYTLGSHSYITQFGNTTTSFATTGTVSQYFFPLGNHTTYDNFRWQTYLTADQVKTSVNVWARTSTALNDGAYYITTSGETGTDGDYQASIAAVRPACVIKLS